MERTISDLVEAYEKGRFTRRQLIQSLALLAGSATTLGSAASAAQQSKATSFRAVNVNHIGITVSDPQKSKEWYKRVFNLHELPVKAPNHSKVLPVEFLGFGSSLNDRPMNTFLVLRKAGKVTAGTYFPPGSINHICFAVDNYTDDRAVQELKKVGIEGEVDRNPDWELGGTLFFDPDGLRIQVGATSTRPL